MNFYQTLKGAWSDQNSLLCVGLDSVLDKLPASFRQSSTPLYDFNRAIIDATAKFVSSFKLQIAFYSSLGRESELEKSIHYIKERYPAIVVILDAKRSDIGNTSEAYAREAFERYRADAVTVNPYLGGDSLEPFLAWKDRGVIILCRTSNPGAGDLQDLECQGRKLYIHVAEMAANRWNKNENVSLVVGATYPQEIGEIRKVVGDKIAFLVPGIGAQGGDLKETVSRGKDSSGLGLMIHSARSIIYASSGDDFQEAAEREAKKLRDEINLYR